MLWEDRQKEEIKCNYELPDFKWYEIVYPIMKKMITEAYTGSVIE